MADWLVTWPAAAAAVVLLIAPGIGPAYALGLRGLVAWGAAPLLSGAVVGGVAIGAGALGLGWNVGWVILGSVLVSGVGLGAWFLGGCRCTPRLQPGARRRAVAWAVGIGGVLAAALQLRRTMVAIGGPDHIAQAVDTTFHLNAIQMILDSGDASSLHMTMTNPGATSGFYPLLWHDIANLVVQLTGVSVPAAANWVTLAITAVVWPLTLLALVRVVCGASPLLLGITAPAAFIITQFPNGLVAYGLLYPNILSYAILPAAVALVVLATIRTHGRGRLPAGTGVALGLVALVCAQPNGVFALMWISVPLLVHALARRTGRMRRAGRSWWRAVVPWPVAAVGTVVVLWAANRVPIVAAFNGRVVWTVETTWQQAVGEVLKLSARLPSIAGNPPRMVDATPLYVAAALVLIGFVAALCVSRWRWMSFSYVLLAFLYVLARGWDIPLRASFTGYWYADAQRLASLLPILGVPLAVIGLGAVTWLVLQGARRLLLPDTGVRRHGRSRLANGRRAVLPPRIAAGAAVVLALVMTIALPRTAPYRESFTFLAYVYRMDTDTGAGLLSAGEVKLFDRVDEIVPPTETIAGNPWDGSALVWAFADRQAIFPHLGMNMDPDRVVVATSLRDAATDPRVCPAVERLHLGYVLDFGHELQGGDHSAAYAGLENLQDSGVVTLVAQEGQAKLYKLTACQSVPGG